MSDKHGTVLIIDDSPTSAHQLFALLGEEYEVLVAARGPGGIELAATQHPDLILLDVVMPGMDGYEVCKRLKEEPRTADIPIVFVTARGEECDETLGLSLGAIDYLTKPLRPAIVRARIKNHVELKRNRDLLQRLTMQDPLTGIDNRRRFDTYLEAEWSRAAREEHVLSLLLIDVDRFKEVNDRYGHGFGDHCLTRIAATLHGCLQRAADVVARYGGEEFGCILPGTDLPGAARMAERMRAAVEALAIPVAPADSGMSESPLRITVSLGVASALPRADVPPRTLLEAADHALYEAKLSGRNCVCMQADAEASLHAAVVATTQAGRANP
ncbi:MAG TPA: diguanylate cyclase [Rhodocyclaceae bacterium]